MPAKYEKLGISFQYPDNWNLDESDAAAGRDSVTVYAPGGGFWTVAVYPHSADPAKLARAAVDALKEEYAEIEVDTVTEQIRHFDLLGYDVSFYYLDLINTAWIRAVRTPTAVYTIYCQAEDRDFEEIQMVFAAMTTSLLGGVGGAAG